MSDFDAIPEFRLAFGTAHFGSVCAVGFEFRPGGMVLRRLAGSPPIPQAEVTAAARTEDAVALAEAILSAYAPEKLASAGRRIAVVDASRLRGEGDSITGAIALHGLRILKGGFVNFVLGAKVPTVIFGDRGPADREAGRLADTVITAPGPTVLTCQVVSARRAVRSIEVVG